jgi:large subunit ribosomal protein L15
MKLHDLQPARGAHTPRTRVGRGIAAGKGKTAGRGTKGQKSRTGGTIPAWFEGGQTPIHIRIPKLRGFRNRGKVEYEVVNLGRIGQLVELGALDSGELPGGRTGGRTATKAAPITINQEILRATGLVSTLKKPLKVLGTGEISVPLFVVADAFSKSAVAKIEAAGGSVQVLELPATPMAALLGEPAASSGDATAPVRAAARAEAISEMGESSQPAVTSPQRAATAERSRRERPNADRATADGSEPVRSKGNRATSERPDARPAERIAPGMAESTAASERGATTRRSRAAGPKPPAAPDSGARRESQASSDESGGAA